MISAHGCGYRFRLLRVEQTVHHARVRAHTHRGSSISASVNVRLTFPARMLPSGPVTHPAQSAPRGNGELPVSVPAYSTAEPPPPPTLSPLPPCLPLPPSSLPLPPSSLRLILRAPRCRRRFSESRLQVWSRRRARAGRRSGRTRGLCGRSPSNSFISLSSSAVNPGKVASWEFGSARSHNQQRMTS